jgi:fatty acid synthase, animal type
MGPVVKVAILFYFRYVFILIFYVTYRYSNSTDTSGSITIAYAGVNNIDLSAVSSMVDDLKLIDNTIIRFYITHIFIFFFKKTEFGVEFSGTKTNGQKVMGLVKTGALSTTVNESNAILWDVPESWTLRQAATVPYSYFVVKCKS